MKEIAHSYVAEKVVGKEYSDLYVGSLLPDLVPYTVATEVLEPALWDTQHAEKFYTYLQKKAPERILVAIGILAHGRLYGADRYNDVEYQSGPGYAYQKRTEKLIEEVWQCSGISRDAAPVRAHNFIELGLDWLLSRKYPKLVERIGEALMKVDLEKLSQYLSECFQKDQRKILAGLYQLFGCFDPRDLKSVEGLARIWARLAARLPEHDKVDIKKATKVIFKAADLIKDDYQEFLDFTISEVRKNLQFYITPIR